VVYLSQTIVNSVIRYINIMGIASDRNLHRTFTGEYPNSCRCRDFSKHEGSKWIEHILSEQNRIYLIFTLVVSLLNNNKNITKYFLVSLITESSCFAQTLRHFAAIAMSCGNEKYCKYCLFFKHIVRFPKMVRTFFHCTAYFILRNEVTILTVVRINTIHGR